MRASTNIVPGSFCGSDIEPGTFHLLAGTDIPAGFGVPRPRLTAEPDGLSADDPGRISEENGVADRSGEEALPSASA